MFIQAYFYVILDSNSNYSFNIKLKIKYSMERILIKIKQETARKKICSDGFSWVQTERPHRPRPKQNFALFCHSKTMAVENLK